MTTPLEEFEQLKQHHIAALGRDEIAKDLTRKWFERVSWNRYSYHFTWMGVPIIQFPQDIVALQEIIWQTRPQVIVETGIAHGGSLVFSASMLELIGVGHVIGIDVEIRSHNRKAIEDHPLAHRISMLEGSSTDPEILTEVSRRVAGKRTMVVLDSDHTHFHVLKELRSYASLVSVGCYLIVFDTIIEDLPDSMWANRPWKRGNNPKTAVHEFLSETDRFVLDASIPNKLLVTVAPDGFLRCVREP